MTEELLAARGRLADRAAPWGEAGVADRPFRTWLAGTALLSLLLGAVTIGREPLWNDELATLAVVERPFTEFLHELPGRQNGMLFDFVLWPLVHLFGPSEEVVRAPALAAVVGAVVLCGLVGARLAGRRVGALAALLFAVHPAAVYYAQEARPYGFVLFFSLLSVWTLMRALERPTLWRFAAYVLCLAALAYSHDFAVLAVLAHPALALALGSRTARRRFAVALGVPVLLAVPLLVFVPDDWGRQALYWIPDPSPDRVLAALGLLAGRRAFVIPVGLVLAAGLLWPAARARAARLVSSVPWTYAFLGLWLLAPITVLYLVSLARPVLVPRYAIAGVPAVCLALALVLALPRARLALAAAAVAAAALLVRSVDDDVERTKSDWPGAAAYLASAAGPEETVVVVGDALHHANGLFYYAPELGVERDRLLWGDDVEERLPERFVLVNGGGTGSGLVSVPERGDSAWLVLSNFVAPQVQRRLADLLAACAKAERRSFTDVDVLHLTGCSGRP